MIHPAHWAAANPNKPAYIMAGSSEVVTYSALETISNRFAQMFRALGLASGDHIALLVENRPGFFEICWGAQRAGLYFTPISTRFHAAEVAHIVRDSGARLIIISALFGELAARLVPLLPPFVVRLALGGAVSGYDSCEEHLDRHSDRPITDQTAGSPMLYSSGTTGRAKGIKRELAAGAYDAPTPGLLIFKQLYHFDDSTVYLSPAPLYHAAPLTYTMGTMRVGGTVIVMEHFDAASSLDFIERHKATHSQWVPTMFVRMLKLPERQRYGRDLSSHRVAIHASAPCPVPVKRQMLEWWGPILYEFYAGTEGNGVCAIGPEEWLRHPGSVGRALLGELRVLREDGTLAGPYEPGAIYFANGVPFVYHNDPEKTREVHTEAGWSTLGDIGHLDEEGYLYLTDRKVDVVIVGGVNVYPQEAENLLVTHPLVTDAAVFGVPNEEFGEEVKAVIQPTHMASVGSELERQLIDFCRANIADIKCPRSVDFAHELPRDPTGKLHKRLLRDRYRDNYRAK
jgi:long-chain acyl-CoA synthetase